ncbi:hypothetical protein Tco_0700197 [Tanacetum coccineum]
MAIPEDHLAKFHKMTDAKEMWNAIKSRFGGNDESKKMQKYILKQQFEGFSVSNTDGIHKGYERFQSLLSQLEIHGAGSTASSSNLQNVAFVSENTNSTNEVSTAYGVSNTSGHCSKHEQTSTSSYSLLASQSSCPQLDHEDLDQKEESRALVTVDGECVDWTAHTEDDENFAFMASNSSGSDTQVCSNECKESYANLKRLYDAQREELSDASVEIKAYTQGLKKVEAQLVAHQQGQLWYEQKIKFMKIDLDDKTDVLTYHKTLLAKAQKEKDDLEVIVDKWNHSSKNLGKIISYQMSASDKFGLGYGDYRYSGILSYENEVLNSVFKGNNSDFENLPLHKRLAKTCEMQAVPPPMTGNYMPSGPDIEIDDSQYTYGPEKTQPSESESQTTELDTCDSNISTEPSELVSEPVVNESPIEVQPKVWSDAPIIEEYESDSDNECVTVQTKGLDTPSFANKQVKTPKKNVKNQSTHGQKLKVNNKELGQRLTERACFVCGSFSHLIRDCDYHVKLAKQVELHKQNMTKGNGTGERKPTWNNVQRVNEQNKFVPSAVQTKTAKASSTNNFSTARQKVNQQTVLTSTALKVNTIKPIVNDVRPANVFHKTHSPSSRPFKRTTVLRTNFSKQKVYTAKVKEVSTVGGKWDTADNPHRTLKNKGIIDSGCSRHMTGNKAYLADFQDFNGGPVAFGGSKGYITGKGKIKTGKLDFEDVSFVKELQHFNLFSVSQMCDKKNKVGYSLQSKAFRVYNLVTKRVEENLHINFLENKPNVAGKGPNWLFDLDYLTDSMNYLSVSSENQANIHAGQQESNQNAGTKDKIVVGDSEKEDESAQDCFEVPFWHSYSSTNTSSSKSDKKRGTKASGTNFVNTVSTPVNTASANEGLSISDTTNFQEDDSEIPPLEDIHEDATDGIFTHSSYDDEGAVADFTNLEAIVNVSPIPTSRIHPSHPSTLILGDPTSAVQTRSKVNKSSEAHAFVSYVQKQRRTNHKDFHHCLFACFLSQHEPKKILEALEDESWVDAMQEDCCRLNSPSDGLKSAFFSMARLMKEYVTQHKLSKIQSPQKVDKSGKLCMDYIKLQELVLRLPSTPIETQKPLVKDEEASDVDVHLYRSMIGSLMYVTASRPDIMFAVCACSRFQVTPKTSHLSAVKRIFRYLKGKPKLGLWYPRESLFDLESYSDSDYAGANLDRKSTTGGCQFLGRRLITWQCKKQTIVATSTTEAEYVAAASCCGQVLWIQNQMLDYGFNFMNTKIYIDNESTICIVKNPVYHLKTKHIAIRHHFIRDAYEKKLIQVLKIHTNDNVADLLTKAFDVSRF